MTLPLPDSCLYEAAEFEIATGFLGEQEAGAQGGHIPSEWRSPGAPWGTGWPWPMVTVVATE